MNDKSPKIDNKSVRYSPTPHRSILTVGARRKRRYVRHRSVHESRIGAGRVAVRRWIVLTTANLVVANRVKEGAVKLLSVKIEGQLRAAHMGIAHPAAEKSEGWVGVGGQAMNNKEAVQTTERKLTRVLHKKKVDLTTPTRRRPSCADPTHPRFSRVGQSVGKLQS